MTQIEELTRYFDRALREIVVVLAEAEHAGSRAMDDRVGATGDRPRHQTVVPTPEMRLIPEDDLGVVIAPEVLGPVVARLVNYGGIHHLTTITAIEVGETVQLKYHFWHGHGLTLETSLGADDLTIVTITDAIPGAAFYEREIHDMFDIHFRGNADLRPLLLPDDWQGGPPLRKGEDDD